MKNKTFMKSKFFSLLGGGTVVMVVVAILSLSDVLIAGIRLGENAVAAVNLIVPVYSFAGFAGSMVSLGVPVIYNRFMGQFKKDEADKVFATGFTVSLIVGVVMFLLLLLFGDVYLRFYGASPEVTELAKSYFFWYKLVILQMPIAALLMESIMADGGETLSTVSGVVQFVSNLALSVIFSGFWGLTGIGIASFIGNYLGLFVLFIHFFKKSCSLKPKLYLSKKVLAEVAKFSLIDSGVYLFIAAFSALMNKFVLMHFGAPYLILVSSIVTVMDVELLFDGIGEAVNPLMGIYLNEKSYDGVHRLYSFAQKVAIVEGVVLTMVLAAFSPLIVKALGIEDPSIAGYAVTGFRIMALGYVGISLVYLMTSYYLVCRKIALGFFVSALSHFLMPVLFTLVFSFVFGIYGLFAGMAVAPFVSLGISYLVIVKLYGKANTPLIIDAEEKAVDSHLFNVTIEPEGIIKLQKSVEELLVSHGRDHRHVGKVKLIIEDMFMIVYEKNGNKPVLGECTVLFEGESERIIIKDDGVLFSLTEGDVAVGSLTTYLVANYMADTDEKMYLTTMSYNRNVFVVD